MPSWYQQSPWNQRRTNLIPRWHQFGTWCQGGTHKSPDNNLAPLLQHGSAFGTSKVNMLQLGTSLVTSWNQVGTKLVGAWQQIVTKLPSKFYGAGANLVQSWCQSGISWIVANSRVPTWWPTWYQIDTRTNLVQTCKWETQKNGRTNLSQMAKTKTKKGGVCLVSLQR